MAVSLLINARSSIPINIHCAAEGVNLLVPVMVLRIVHLIMSNSLVPSLRYTSCFLLPSTVARNVPGRVFVRNVIYVTLPR